MADPLSTAASVAGLVSLAIHLSQLSFQYVSNVRGSSRAWSSYIQELSALTSVLLKVQQASEAVSTVATLPGPGISPSAIRDCEHELTSLKKVLSDKLQKRGIRGKLDMLTWPFSEADTATKVKQLHRFNSLFSSSLMADHLTISIASHRQLTDIKDVDEFEGLLRWVEPKCDPPCILLEPIVEEICPGTRKAVLESRTFLEWRDGQAEKPANPLLACGPPGCGKTFLSAAITDDVLSSRTDATVAYHFFRNDQPEFLVDVLRHLVYQQLSQPTGTSKVALDLHRKKKRYKAPSRPKDLIDILCDIASTSGRSYMILDGIDEFPYYSKLLKYLPQLLKAGARCFIASRDLPTIRGFLPNAVDLDSRASAGDVIAYVKWRLEEDSGLDDTVFTDDLKQEICSKLAEHANGSFLLSRLLMDLVCGATTVKKLRRALESLPLNYAEAYKNTLDRILQQDGDRQELAKHALQWVCSSRRPLDMTELQHAIASLDEDAVYGKEDLETEITIISSCLGLLVHHRKSQTVELVHSSAKEIVLRHLGLDGRKSQIAISKACLRYMSSVEMSKGPCRSVEDLRTRIATRPFLEYTTRHYGDHIKQVENVLLPDLFAFLQNEEFRQSSWQLLHFIFKIDSQSAQELIDTIPSSASMLHVACYWGFSSLLQRMLGRQPVCDTLDQSDSHGWTGVHWAASNGRTEILSRLLDAGAGIDALDRGEWTPLFWATVKGHTAAVTLLLERGANPFHVDGSGFTCLHWSILSGFEVVTDILLDYGYQRVYEEREESKKRTISAETLSVEEARALRTPQAPKNAKNLFQLVSETSNLDGFKKLVESFEEYDEMGYHNVGLNITKFDKVWDRTKVMLSKSDSSWWYMLERESPIDSLRRRLLTNAIRCEDIDMVRNILQLSLDAGMDLSSELVLRQEATYAHVAAYSGSVEIMRLLIDTGLSLQVTDNRGMSPLHYACRTGTYAVIEVLLGSGAEVDQQAEPFQYTPLMVLLQCGAWRTNQCPGETLKIFKALIASGASIDARDANGNAVFHHAVMSYDPTVIQAMLDLGADPGTLSNSLMTPLHFLTAGYCEHRLSGLEPYEDVPPHIMQAVVKLLLSVSPSSSITQPMKHGRSLLALAIHHGKWILSQALLLAGAPFISTSDLSTDLNTVSKQGFYELSCLLINHGARPEDADIFSTICMMAQADKPHSWANNLVSLEDIPESFPSRNHERVVRELAALTEAKINQEIHIPLSYFKMTAIQVAAERGVDAGLLAALLDGGADPYVETSEGLDSFLLALVCGKMDSLTVLLEKAFDNLSYDHWLTNWLRESGMSGAPRGQATFDVYLSAIADTGWAHGWDANGHSLLFHAVGRENLLLADELLKLGANPNLADPLGWTPFHEAVRVGNVPLVQAMVYYGADIFMTVSNVSPYSAFSPSDDSAITYGESLVPAINSLHIAVGVNPHNQDLEAGARLSPEMVRYLLNLGLDPNTKTQHTSGLPFWDLREEETPLQIMFRSGRHEWSPTFFQVVQMLLGRGADAAGVAQRMSPYDVAGFEGHEELWTHIRTAGVGVVNVSGY